MESPSPRTASWPMTGSASAPQTKSPSCSISRIPSSTRSTTSPASSSKAAGVASAAGSAASPSLGCFPRASISSAVFGPRFFSASSSAAICWRSASFILPICSTLTSGCCWTMVGSMLTPQRGLIGPQRLNGAVQPTVTPQYVGRHCWNVWRQPCGVVPQIEKGGCVQSLQVKPQLPGVVPQMENACCVQSLQVKPQPPPGVVPQIENCWTVQSLQPAVGTQARAAAIGLTPHVKKPHGVVPQIEYAWLVQSVQPKVGLHGRATAAGLTLQATGHPAPPPTSGGCMVSGMTLMPRSLIFGISPPSGAGAP